MRLKSDYRCFKIERNDINSTGMGVCKLCEFTSWKNMMYKCLLTDDKKDIIYNEFNLCSDCKSLFDPDIKYEIEISEVVKDEKRN